MSKASSLTNLSNEELRKKLEHYGANAGPVTPSTRRLYERKLVQLMADLPAAVQEEFFDTSSNQQTNKLPLMANKNSFSSRLETFVKWIFFFAIALFISVAFIGSWVYNEPKKDEI